VSPFEKACCYMQKSSSAILAGLKFVDFRVFFGIFLEMFENQKSKNWILGSHLPLLYFLMTYGHVHGRGRAVHFRLFGFLVKERRAVNWLFGYFTFFDFRFFFWKCSGTKNVRIGIEVVTCIFWTL